MNFTLSLSLSLSSLTHSLLYIFNLPFLLPPFLLILTHSHPLPLILLYSHSLTHPLSPFLFLLPLSPLAIGGTCVGNQKADLLATLYDVGGIVGQLQLVHVFIFLVPD